MSQPVEIMPHAHEDQELNGLNQGDNSEEYLEEQEEGYQELQMSVEQGVSRDGGNPVRTYCVASIPPTVTTASLLALMQRSQAQRKQQMANMMANKGMHFDMSFPRVIAQHTVAAADDAKHNNQNHAMYVASRRARGDNFTTKETFDLLKIWASPEMQWQMKHNFRNFKVWEAISFSIRKMGHERTAIQCKNRIQNLTSFFYRIRKSKWDYRSLNFPYYKLIEKVLDVKKNAKGAIDEISSRNGESSGERGLKRSVSSSSHPYVKTQYAREDGAENAAKRPKISSTATDAFFTQTDDPIGQYLTEMIDIERQWLEMERERAENERAMMTYMMQIFQATVCPRQSLEEKGEGEEEGTELENDRKATILEFAEAEQETDDDEIRL